MLLRGWHGAKGEVVLLTLFFFGPEYYLRVYLIARSCCELLNRRLVCTAQSGGMQMGLCSSFAF